MTVEVGGGRKAKRAAHVVIMGAAGRGDERIKYRLVFGEGSNELLEETDLGFEAFADAHVNMRATTSAYRAPEYLQGLGDRG